MICSVLVSGFVCVVVPNNDIRDRIIHYRIEAAHAHTGYGYVKPLESLELEVPVPAKKPKLKRKTQKTTTAPKKLGRQRVKLAVATGGDKLVRPSILSRLFGVRSAKASVPKVAGVDLKKPGYAAVYAAAKKHGVDPNLALRVAKQESRGNCKALSHAGARGVMQVIPSTARPHGVSASELYNCKRGAEAGVRELKKLHSMYGGDIKKVLVGYNCGIGCVQKGRMPAETKSYVNIVGGGKL